MIRSPRAGRIGTGKIQVRLRCIDRRLRLADDRLLQVDLRIEVRDRCCGSLDVGLGLDSAALMVAIVDLGEHLASLHRIIVVDKNVGDVTGKPSAQPSCSQPSHRHRLWIR